MLGPTVIVLGKFKSRKWLYVFYATGCERKIRNNKRLYYKTILIFVLKNKLQNKKIDTKQ